ncbi:MAG: 4Fe-4S binding protein [Candidatus Helarchaeota archaeon]
MYSVVNPEKCIGCQECAEVCPYNAIEMESKVKKINEDQELIFKLAKINEALCKGYGTCIPKCPVRTISQKHFETEEIMMMIQDLFNKST